MLIPILAEIADKMPTIDELWQSGLVMSLLLAPLTFTCAFLIKQPLGAIVASVVILPALWFSSICWSEPLFDNAIIKELGVKYLWYWRAYWCVPAAMSLLGGLSGIGLSVYRLRFVESVQSCIGLKSAYWRG